MTDELQAPVWDYLSHEWAASSVRAYRSDWAHFDTWCTEVSRQHNPASGETVAMYVRACIPELKSTTIRRRIQTIALVHSLMRHQWGDQQPTLDDEVQHVIGGLNGTADSKQPIDLHHIKLMALLTNTDRLIDVRDRALILIGFAGAFRRGHVVGISIENAFVNHRALTLHVQGQSKHSPDRIVTIPRSGSDTCPVAAYERWLTASAVTEGAVFRRVDRHSRMGGRMSGRAYAERIKKLAQGVGLAAEQVAGQSIRSGAILHLISSGLDLPTLRAHARVTPIQLHQLTRDMPPDPAANVTRYLGL